MKLILFVKRRPDLTHAQFKARYEAGHAPLARRVLPHLRKYVRNYLEQLPGMPAPEYDVVTEFWFDDQAGMEATLGWTTGTQAGQVLAIDEAEFMDRGSMLCYLAHETQLPGED